MTLSSTLGACGVSLLCFLGIQTLAHGETYGPNPQLFTSGLITTGLTYTPAVIVAINSRRDEDKFLYYPFVGPWIDLANRTNAGDNRTNRALLVIDGVAQGIGALQLAASFMFIDTGDEQSTNRSGVRARLVPARFGSKGYGLTALGQFW